MSYIPDHTAEHEDTNTWRDSDTPTDRELSKRSICRFPPALHISFFWWHSGPPSLVVDLFLLK